MSPEWFEKQNKRYRYVTEYNRDNAIDWLNSYYEYDHDDRELVEDAADVIQALLDASDQGMSVDLLQKAIDITRYADPGTPYGYLKTILDDWLGQNIYTMHDWQVLQKKKRDAKNRQIPSIPIYKI